MAGTYTIDFTDVAKGSFTIYPHEVNGPGNTKAWNVVGVVSGSSGDFTIAGNFADRFIFGFSFNIVGSTGNDGTYTVRAGGSIFNINSHTTTIPVDEVIASATIDGQVQYDIEQNTSLQLPGRGSINYGELLLENMVALVENFSATTAPINPTSGQSWYKSDTKEFKIYDGANWIPPAASLTTLPALNQGALWYDIGIPQLNIYDGGWVSVADRYVLKSGDSMVGTLVLESGANITHNGNDFIMSAGRDVSLTLSNSFAVNSSGNISIDTNASGGTSIVLDASTDLILQGNGTNSDVQINAQGTNAGVIFNVGGGTTSLIIDPSGLMHLDGALSYTGLLSNPNDIVNKEYVDITFLQLTGGTLTNFLTLHANPTAAMHAATKQYTDSTFVDQAGDVMSGDLSMGNIARVSDLQDPSAAQDAATKNYVDTKFMIRAGDTMTGPLILNNDPTLLLEASTKQYVDNSSSLNVVNVNGGMSPYATPPTDNLLIVDATANNIIINLHAITADRSQPLIIKRVDGSANTVTIVADGVETIDGITSQTLPGQWDKLRIMHNLVDWFII